jgi:hypothetical protein
MIDLETMGTGPTAAIVQIGVVIFDPMAGGDWLVAASEWDVNLLSSLFDGNATMDRDTLEWWMTQAPEEARAALARAEPCRLGDALEALAAFLEEYEVKRVWAHGAAFDLPIVDHACCSLGRVVPWSYRAARDTRTLFELAKDQGWERENAKVAHNAMADAIAQARDVCSALATLRGEPFTF